MQRFVALVLGLVVAGCAGSAPDTDDEMAEQTPGNVDSDSDGQAEVDWSHTSVAPAEFRQRWNDAIAAYGYGPTLGPLDQDDGEQLGLLLDEQSPHEWLRVEVSTHPDGPVAQTHIYADPRSAGEVSEALAAAAALVSASSSFDPAGAEQLVTEELRGAETTEFGDYFMKDVERDGQRYEFTVTPQNPAGEVVAHMTFVMTSLDEG